MRSFNLSVICAQHDLLRAELFSTLDSSQPLNVGVDDIIHQTVLSLSEPVEKLSEQWSETEEGKSDWQLSRDRE